MTAITIFSLIGNYVTIYQLRVHTLQEEENDTVSVQLNRVDEIALRVVTKVKERIYRKLKKPYTQMNREQIARRERTWMKVSLIKFSASKAFPTWLVPLADI